MREASGSKNIHVRLVNGGEYREIGPFSISALEDIQPYMATKSLNGLTIPRHLHISRGWIRRCTRGHKICNDGLSERFLPTRLLDLGSLKDKFCVLRITADLADRKYKYMTLSHRWGSAKFLKLETSNIKKFEGGIALSELTKTFQDAISVTRSLGVKYLWIDALCIIQGPTMEDWATEASRMCDVYRHSWCNISALWAEDHQQGFLKLGGSDNSFWTHINIDWDDMGQEKDWVILDHSIWTEEVAQSPLNRRAWVVQERTLSPRQLYFGRTHMFWQCHEFSSFELVPRLCYPHSDLRAPFQNNASEDFFKPKRPSGQNETLSLWAQYVDLYSVCSLTKPEDKLIAISGLAQDIHRTIPEDEYIVGFWRSQLPYQLMWRANVESVESKPITTSSRPSSLAIPLRSGNPAYRSPSWSWAYTDVGVIAFKDDFLHDQDLLLAEIKRAELNFTAPSHLYGQVLDAQLILTGVPIPVSHSVNAGQHQLSIGSSQQAALRRLFIYFDQNFSTSWNGNEDCDKHLFCLPLRYTSWHSTKSVVCEAEVSGLLLIRWNATMDCPAQYSRVGMFLAFGVENCCNFGVIFEELERGKELAIRQLKAKGYRFVEDGTDGVVERESDRKLRMAKGADKSRWEDIILV